MANVLTPIQERFVEAYVTHPDVASALVTAGYALHHSTGSKLLRKPHIQAAIAERQKRLRDDCHVERQHIAAMLLESHARADTVAEEIQVARQLGLLFGLYKDTS